MAMVLFCFALVKSGFNGGLISFICIPLSYFPGTGTLHNWLKLTITEPQQTKETHQGIGMNSFNTFLVIGYGVSIMSILEQKYCYKGTYYIYKLVYT